MCIYTANRIIKHLSIKISLVFVLSSQELTSRLKGCYYRYNLIGSYHVHTTNYTFGCCTVCIISINKRQTLRSICFVIIEWSKNVEFYQQFSVFRFIVRFVVSQRIHSRNHVTLLRKKLVFRSFSFFIFRKTSFKLFF